MNKNILRALRRDIRSLFEDFLLKNHLSISKSKRIFKTNLRKYSEYLLMISSPIHQELIDELNPENFKKILGLFLNTCAIKKILKDDGDESKIEEFNSLLYSYSHQKFYNYITLPEVQFIICVFFSEIGVDGFINNHRALSVNRNSYLEHISSTLMMV